LFPEEVVRNLAIGKEVRENAGAVPPAPDDTNSEMPDEQGVATRGIRLAFTHDNRFLIAGAFPSKVDAEKTRKEHRRPDGMPRGA
jgi:hypothetical protein